MENQERTSAQILAENVYTKEGKLFVAKGNHEVELADMSKKIREAILNNALFLNKAHAENNKMIFKNHKSVYQAVNDIVRMAIVNNLGKENENQKIEEYMSLEGSDNIHKISDDATFPIAQKERNELMKCTANT